MPLRCIDENQKNIHAFDLPDEAWQSLNERNRSERHLRMPCCAAPVTLKKSKLGTRFFAHKAKGECITAPETENHLRLKQIAVEAARSQGWDAEAEVSGQTPSGDLWRADVLASKGKAKVAVEIQWSNQTADETLRRQDRYRASGVRGLWLLQRRGAPVSLSLPCAVVSVDADQDFTATLSSGQKLPVAQFLQAAFAGRLKFGVPADVAGTVSISVAPVQCWHRSCGADNIIVTGVEVAFGPHKRRFTVADFDVRPALLSSVLSSLPSDLPIGSIKPRFSRTMETEYLSNGCIKCDRLFGQHFEHEVWHEEYAVASFPIRASGSWLDLFRGDEEEFESWAVFRTNELAV